MKMINKYRIKNPYFYLVFLSLFLVLLISYVVGSQLYDMYFKNMEIRIKESPGLSRESYFDTMGGILSWETACIYGFMYLVRYFPVFPAIVALGFSKELHGYFPHACHRLPHPGRQIRLACLWYGVTGGCAVSAALCAFWMTLAPFVKTATSHLGRYTELFPKYFYALHPLPVFLLMSCTVYFGLGFVYGYLAAGIALWKNHAVFIIAVPLIFFHAECFFSNSIGNILLFDIGACVTPFQGYYNPVEQMVPLLGVAALGVLVIELRLRCKKSWVIE